MKTISIAIENRIGYITIQRAEKRNALNAELITELSESFDAFETDDKVKVIVIKADGTTFCSGADLESLQEMQNNTYEQNLADSNRLKDLYYKIYTFKKIVIAQVQGHALAGGCGLVSICDFSFSVPEANFGYTESRIGFVPAIVLSFLVRKIGENKARMMLLTGNVIKASEAYHIGLITHICENEKDLIKSVYEFATSIIEHNASSSIELTKKLFYSLPNLPLEEALTIAASTNALARQSEDCKKGIAAFLNKETLKW
jgi:methylglutaconyl-CoA hydratase